MAETTAAPRTQNLYLVDAVAISLIAALAFAFSIKPTQQHFDYTARIASAFLHGHVGLTTKPPSWLNEVVPQDGRFYSVFPLGAVLTVMPVALLQQIGLVHDFPARAAGSIIVAVCVFFVFRLSIAAGKSLPKSAAISLSLIFGTWTWCNLGFGGAWQLALGFALLGELGALYFILVDPRPFVAGCFFAIAYGNRTELVICFPIFVWLLIDSDGVGRIKIGQILARLLEKWDEIEWLAAMPLALGLATAVYNYARFGSPFDFGYARIPRLLSEPWYQHGLFSLHAIPWNSYKMLFEGFRDIPRAPFISFAPFGCSIFLVSPVLFLLFREGGTRRALWWMTIAVLTFVLWSHGNPGGWQFSYRYATELLPWMFLLILGNGPARMTAIEWSLIVVSVAINGVATYQFLWTESIHP